MPYIVDRSRPLGSLLSVGLNYKTVGDFFSKSVKKSVKRGVRVLRARSMQALHARRACEARDKKRLSPVLLSVFSLVPDLLLDLI